MTSDEVRSTARNGAERAVHQVLRAMGRTALTEQPIEGFTSITRTVPTNWKDGITATRMVADAGRHMMYRYAGDARGAGLSWRELADTLGVRTDDDYTDPAAAAFELIAGEPAQRFDEVTTSWRCATCGKYVTDKGPYNGHPTDCERGHAEDCGRHQAEIAAYEASLEDA